MKWVMPFTALFVRKSVIIHFFRVGYIAKLEGETPDEWLVSLARHMKVCVEL